MPKSDGPDAVAGLGYERVVLEVEALYCAGSAARVDRFISVTHDAPARSTSDINVQYRTSPPSEFARTRACAPSEKVRVG